MVKKLKDICKKVHISRTTVLAVFFILLSGVLIHRLYQLQIISVSDITTGTFQCSLFRCSNGEVFAVFLSFNDLQRFKADVYGESFIDDLEPAQAEATADELMSYLISEDRFAVIRNKNPYSEEELAKYGLPAELTKDELLKIATIRYALSLTSYQKYLLRLLHLQEYLYFLSEQLQIPLKGLWQWSLEDISGNWSMKKLWRLLYREVTVLKLYM